MGCLLSKPRDFSTGLDCNASCMEGPETSANQAGLP